MEAIQQNMDVMRWVFDRRGWFDWLIRTGLTLGIVLAYLAGMVLFAGAQVSYSATSDAESPAPMMMHKSR